jgi:hypothetical protein
MREESRRNGQYEVKRYKTLPSVLRLSLKYDSLYM